MPSQQPISTYYLKLYFEILITVFKMWTMNDTLILCICTVFILNSTLAHLVCMHTFDEKISIVPLYNTNVIIKCFIGTHVWMFINANPKYLCRSDIFVFNTHTWTCSLSMYRLFVVSVTSWKLNCFNQLIKAGMFGSKWKVIQLFRKKKVLERSSCSWGQDLLLNETLFQWEYEVLKS